MNVEPDKFEGRLSQQPLRRIPAKWHEEILAAASYPPLPVERRSFLSTVTSQLSTILWPHPVAWAGLAAIWIFIFAVDLSTGDRTPVVAQRTSPPPMELIIEVRQQQRLLAELLGPRETRDADRQRIFVPRPRSERAEILSA